MVALRVAKETLAPSALGDFAIYQLFFEAVIMKYATSDFIKEYHRTVFETYSANIEFGEKQTEIIFWDVSGDDRFAR